MKKVTKAERGLKTSNKGKPLKKSIKLRGRF